MVDPSIVLKSPDSIARELGAKPTVQDVSTRRTVSNTAICTSWMDVEGFRSASRTSESPSLSPLASCFLQEMLAFGERCTIVIARPTVEATNAEQRFRTIHYESPIRCFPEISSHQDLRLSVDHTPFPANSGRVSNVTSTHSPNRLEQPAGWFVENPCLTEPVSDLPARIRQSAMQRFLVQFVDRCRSFPGAYDRSHRRTSIHNQKPGPGLNARTG
jgi:hypothetical protein